MLIVVEPQGQRTGRGEAEGRRLYDAILAYGRDLKEKRPASMRRWPSPKAARR
jgi:hypothetical protein